MCIGELTSPLLSWFILYLFSLGPVGGRDMATQEEGHRRAGSAPHIHMWAHLVPLLLIRRGGKWREGRSQPFIIWFFPTLPHFTNSCILCVWGMLITITINFFPLLCVDNHHSITKHTFYSVQIFFLQ